MIIPFLATEEALYCLAFLGDEGYSGIRELIDEIATIIHTHAVGGREGRKVFDKEMHRRHQEPVLLVILLQ